MGEIIQDAWDVFQYIMRHMLIINFILSIVIVFFQRKNPTSVWAWLLVLYAIPLIGFIFYLFIGTDMHKQKLFKTKEMEDKLNEAIRRQENSIIDNEMEKDDPKLKGNSDLIFYNLKSSGAVLTRDNKVKIFTDGNEKFNALIEDIKQAKEYIHIQYYIIRNDVLFKRIKDELVKKSHEGVEVRILFDSMGCRGVSRRFWKSLEKEGIETAEFFPAILGRLQLRINYRNHRKIAIIDGNIGYVGGYNIGKEYIGMNNKFGYWRDTHLRIVGSAADALQARFILDWNYAAKENLLSKDKFFHVDRSGHEGDCEIQIVTSGPDSTIQNIRNNYLRLIAKAKKNIYIQTPYFIPDDAIYNALQIAILSGIDVNIMIPCKPDHPFVYWATYSYIGDLVLAGAKCYTYQNGFLHAKGMIVDESLLCYGTANMDIRSFKLNFEVNAVIYNAEEAVKMQNIFIEDLRHCKLITKDAYSKRSIKIRIKEQFSRLLSPLL